MNYKKSTNQNYNYRLSRSYFFSTLISRVSHAKTNPSDKMKGQGLYVQRRAGCPQKAAPHETKRITKEKYSIKNCFTTKNRRNSTKKKSENDVKWTIK